MRARRWPLVVLSAVGLFLAGPARAAEVQVQGHVSDSSGARLAQAPVRAIETSRSTATDASGSFSLSLPAGPHTLRSTFPGFARAELRIEVAPGMATVELSLSPAGVSEETVVRAIRPDETAPVTRTLLEREEIEAKDFGQDVPLLLQQAVPGVSAYTESGSGGSGYSYFTIRGIGQTRINMTLDGVPLNDPEESSVFFANFADLVSSIESIEVQRGVGASTVGSAALGGAISFASVAVRDAGWFEAHAASGSFGTRRGSLAAASGPLTRGLQAYGRFSYNESDGYRDHSGIRQRTGFWSLARQASDSLTRFSGFVGRERSSLSYFAPEEAALASNPRVNVMQEEEKDRFGQDLMHVQHSRSLSRSSSLNASLYSSGASGALDLWADPVAKDQLWSYGIDGRANGASLSLNRETGALGLHAAVHASDFHRDHFASSQGLEAYRNTGFKREANAFGKASWAKQSWSVFADAQLRHARFRYQGAQALSPVSWTFFNPRLGARWRVARELTLYASAARAKREPTRNDLFAGEDEPTVAYDLRAVRPESVFDLEAGVEWAGSRGSLKANLYAMEQRDEIALTGELSLVGFPLRRNVPSSFRRGLELEAVWRPVARLALRHSSALSWSRISSWTQQLDVYGSDGSYLTSEPRAFADVEPLLTPWLVANQSIEWRPRSGTAVTATGRVVAGSALDNTNASATTVPGYFQLDLSAGHAVWGERVRLGLDLTNLLNHSRIFPSGYSYPYLVLDSQGRESLTGTRYFYPLATRAVMLSVTLRP